MLVLARKVDESIEIGNGIRIVVLEIGAKQVSLGIQAPKKVRVRRTEVADSEEKKPRKQKSRGAATSGSTI